jgi:hypothetical protein
MEAESGFFAAFYASPIQHPWLLWLAAALGLVLVLTRTGLDAGMRRYGIALACLSFADAWLTSSDVYGIGTLSGGAASAVPLFFVLMGDFRYLLLVTSGTLEGGLVPNGRHLLAAAGLTLIVPIATQLILATLPESHAGPRVMFAIYEVAFFSLTAVLLRVHPNARANPWIRSISRFVMLYYGLWATADVILLGIGSDLGFLLRVLPNLLYYGGLIAAIALFAPTRAQA